MANAVDISKPDTRAHVLQAAIDRADEVLCRTTVDHSMVTVRRRDLLALVLASGKFSTLDAEVAELREKLGSALAAGADHRSDCSVHNAPAYEPTPCDCTVSA